MPPRDTSAGPSRYLKQERVAAIGPEGQHRLGQAAVLVVGVGALGSLIVEQLVRAGVGTVRLVDRDLVERTNLQRQLLYTEADADAAIPKAAAAADRLRAVNSEVVVEAFVEDFTAASARRLLGNSDLILDGTDNLETRYLINDLALAEDTPWIYGGCVGTFGQAAAIVPGRTPCLRCLFPEPPPADAMPTCDTAGVLGPSVHAVASIQSALAMRLLVAGRDAVRPAMTVLDPWEGICRQVTLGSPVAGCPACGSGTFDWLSGERGIAAVALCGRNAVQIGAGEPFDLDSVADRLAADGAIERTRFLTRWRPRERDGWTVTLFPDGRTIIEGTEDVAAARSLHAKWIGA